MADQAKVGTVWGDDEPDAIVGDYFAMLAAERAGEAYVKSHVRWVSQEDGDGAGYDILSFDHTGRERLIEVKTTRGTQKTPFFLSSNERSFADERPEAFRLYRVYEYGEGGRRNWPGELPRNLPLVPG